MLGREHASLPGIPCHLTCQLALLTSPLTTLILESLKHVTTCLPIMGGTCANHVQYNVEGRTTQPISVALKEFNSLARWSQYLPIRESTTTH